MSKQPPECMSRCMAYLHNAPNGHHLAVATNTGQVSIRKVDWKKVAAGEKGALDVVTRELFSKTAVNKWIEAMKYSPKGDYLCVGTHDQRLYVFDIHKKYHKFKGCANDLAMSSAINGIDWAVDQSHVRCSSQAGELLVWTIDGKARQRPRNTHGEREMRGRQWVDHTVKRGYQVEGIYPPGEDGSHVNDCCMS